MIRRVLFLGLLLLLLTAPFSVRAESDISVLNSAVEIDFPNTLIFKLEAGSRADIVDARLHYKVDKMNYAQVTSEGWADFAPATRVRTSWSWDMRRSSLPPGAAISYWWTVVDATGNRLEDMPRELCFDDGRYEWRSLTESDTTLYWYEGSDSFAAELMGVCEQGLARLAQDIGTYPERPVKIYIYASAGDLQAAMVFPREWTGGVAFTEFGIIAIGISAGQLDWGKRALVHELTHLVVHQA
ncbi:MAG: peptidase MA domain-containing protein, partial [Dehalococcoidia bacterium]|nr:peptidase MA domain-containing protein [Dehalococcoidia bacterium]